MKDMFIPIALGIIMLSMGLSLTTADFKRALLYPKAVLIALFCQTILMPTVCFFIVKGMGLGPELAIGLMLLAASPGGVTANLYSHVAGGDVALNITLTAINSLLSLVTLPVILGFSLQYFLGTEHTIPLQTGKVVQVMLIVIVPVLIGMYLRHLKPAFALRMEPRVKILSGLFLLLILISVFVRQGKELNTYFEVVGVAVVLFNVLSLIAGYGIALLVRLEKRQAIAISMEVGVHNTALAAGLALSPLLLNNATIAMPPALYGVLSLVIVAVFAYMVRYKQPAVKNE